MLLVNIFEWYGSLFFVFKLNLNSRSIRTWWFNIAFESIGEGELNEVQ
jgi:hypothetical protein